ncbi:hypothetical protein SeMB42_g04390 [Synchytrium endobioticum]|uniref:Uncharacterized protein n=1 Tax=Synchytrium endobioticum TaxID=286115 RepID=A0A507CYZ7_9FUNG|nr:hypothetical protein SeMB42_g04390 [Synchytrium endobioticum]
MNASRNPERAQWEQSASGKEVHYSQLQYNTRELVNWRAPKRRNARPVKPTPEERVCIMVFSRHRCRCFED